MTDPRVTRHDIPSLNGRQLLKGRLRRQSDRGRNMCAMPAMPFGRARGEAATPIKIYLTDLI